MTVCVTNNTFYFQYQDIGLVTHVKNVFYFGTGWKLASIWILKL